MKKLSLSMLILSAVSLFAVTACDNGGVKESSGLPINRAEVNKRMRNLAKEQGYFINYEMQYNGEHFGVDALGKGETFSYVKANGLQNEGVAIKHQGDYYHIYFLNNLDFEYYMSYQKDVYDQWYENASFITFANGLGAKFTKEDEDLSICDRPATSYTFSYKAEFATKEYNYRAYIDDEYGVTLGIESLDEVPANELISIQTNMFLVGDDVKAPALADVDEEDIVNAEDVMKDWEVKIPEKIALNYFHGDEKLQTERIEIIGKDVYLYNKGDSNESAKFYKFEDGAYTKYERDYYAGEQWVASNGVETAKDVADVLSSNAGCYDAFDLNELHSAKLVGSQVFLGKPVSIYESKRNGTVSRYYLYAEMNMFLLRDDIGEPYRFEVTSFDAEIKAFTDTPDNPLNNALGLF
ncbi:MAG: hypothetical protein IJ247_04020 [Bacilli bacterium]|nr:hypothetical protein [Bacilli bacterium]